MTRCDLPLCFSIFSGPFAPCHDYVDPEPHYSSCVYDVCETDDDGLCDSLKQYAEACKAEGGRPDDWRAEVPQCRKSVWGHVPLNTNRLEEAVYLQGCR